MSKVYWKIFVDEAESLINLTEEQKKGLADDIDGACENMSTALGYDMIPNPCETENDRVVRALQKEIEDLERREDAYVKNIKERYGSDVYIDIDSRNNVKVSMAR